MTGADAALGAAQVAEALTRTYGRALAPGDIHPVRSGPTADLADATAKFRVPGPQSHGPRGFCIVSGPGNPDLMARAADNIATARKTLPPPLAAPILAPVATGRIGERAFAVWPEGRPFPSTRRVTRLWRRQRFARPVMDWCVAVACATATPAAPDTIAADLDTIIADADMPEDMKRDADRARSRLASGRWQPVHCLHHGDFWEGNLLLPLSAERSPVFHVIDWPGMRLRGYPFLDMARMLISMRRRARFSARAIDRLRDRLGCSGDDVLPQLLAGIGHVGRNLEHFPPPLYREMATGLHRFVRALA